MERKVSQFGLPQTSVMLFCWCREANINPMNCEGEKHKRVGRFRIKYCQMHWNVVCSSAQETILLFEYDGLPAAAMCVPLSFDIAPHTDTWALQSIYYASFCNRSSSRHCIFSLIPWQPQWSSEHVRSKSATLWRHLQTKAIHFRHELLLFILYLRTAW